MRWLLVAFIVVVQAVPAYALVSIAAQDCERYAAHPYEPYIQYPGVPHNQIDTDIARSVCEMALEHLPDDPAVMYRLSRVLLQLGESERALDLMSQSAAQNYSPAQAGLGTYYMLRLSEPSNLKASIFWLEKANALGHPLGTYNLGVVYSRGLAGDEKRYRAFPLFLQAARQDYPPAMSAVSDQYRTGYYIERNLKKSLEYVQRGLALNDASAQARMGYYLYHGLGVRRDRSGALEYLRLAASQGKAESLFLMGLMYQEGDAVPRDLKSALEMFQTAANWGSTSAMFRLGYSVQEGLGVEQNPLAALDIYRQLDELGNPAAKFFIAKMYLEGLGVEQDLLKGFGLIEAAAEQGDVEAQFFMGMAYARGDGVAQDFEQAIFWLQAAGALVPPDDAVSAEAIEAQLQLGLLYAQENTGFTNREKSLEWLETASSLGLVEADVEIAQMLADTGQRELALRHVRKVMSIGDDEQRRRTVPVIVSLDGEAEFKISGVPDIQAGVTGR